MKHVITLNVKPKFKLTSTNTGFKFPLLSNDSKTWTKKSNGGKKELQLMY